MAQFLCVIDERNVEVPGSRRKVDFESDPDGFRRTYTALERSMGEGCWIYNSHIDDGSPTLLSSVLAAMICTIAWAAMGLQIAASLLV